jgi:lanthanide-dependent methanol dehydrogenase
LIRPIQIGRLIGLLAICLAGAARIANAQPCDAATAEASSGGACWTTPAGMPQGTRFSTLTDITPANVGTLVEEFATPLGMIGSQQGGPLVVGSTMYVVTPYPNRLVAIDLNSPGTVLWTFDPGESAFAIGVACCDGVNRGAAYSAGLVVYATLDDTVVAVNAATGALAWRARVGNP